MGRTSAYPTLTSELARCGIKKSFVAQILEISDKALYNKLYGDTPLTLDEAFKIRDSLFPHLMLDELFGMNK